MKALNNTLPALALMISLVFGSAWAEDQPVPSDSAAHDSTATQADSAPVETSPAADSTLADSAQAEDVLDMEERLRQFRKKRQRPPRVSWCDTLTAYFCSDRLDLLPYARRATYRDVGDYFRGSPAYWVSTPQSTPMRKTVQPFGLKGNRFGVVSNGLRLEPFQHHPEPDGLMDFELLPSTLDEQAFALQGPAGLLFGSRSAVASLVTRPMKLHDNQPHTGIMGEKGGYSYSWVRGYYQRQFASGKIIKAATGYREADGPFNFRSDESYHYSGEIFLPMGFEYGVQMQGSMYDRDGYLAVRPEAGGATVARDGYGRRGRVAMVRQTGSGSRVDLGYAFNSHISHLNGTYFGRYDQSGHGAFVCWSRVSERSLIMAEATADYEEYWNGFESHFRRHADASLRYARLSDGWRWMVGGGGRYDRTYDFLPWGAMAIHRESDMALVDLSVGYAEREPTLHESFLPATRANLYGNQGATYLDIGSEQLSPEKQLVGSLVCGLGHDRYRLRLSATGGQITDGIDWFSADSTDTSGINLAVFSPANGDISFGNVAASAQAGFLAWFTLHAGGSYHFVDYERHPAPAYSPEYQLYGALEIHYDWRSRLADIYLYGELTYTGPYNGYDEPELGEEPLFNAVATLELKDFRFFLAWENVLNRAYRAREYQTLPGRFFSYGIAWQFLD